MQTTTHYADSRGVSIAHQVHGEGPFDLVFVPGFVSLIGEDVGGIAVNIGARIGAEAIAGEVLVSSTVRELVVGSGLEFADRGVRALRGLPGEWRLFAID